MSKEKIMIINSKDKIFGGSNTNFIVDFSDNDTQQVVKVLVKDCFIPNLFYNIDSSNNTLTIQQTGQGVININIPFGQYTIDSLSATLKDLIDAQLVNGTLVTITRNNITYRLTFTFSGGAVNTVELFNSSSLSDTIGLTNNIVGSVIQMQTIFNLKGVEYVQIHSPEIGYNHGLDAGISSLINLVESVSLANSDFGTIAYRQNNDDELSMILYDQPKNLSRITIKLRDETGRLLELPPNAYMTLMIKIFYD